MNQNFNSFSLLTTSISLNKFIRYSNGKISSILKGEKGFGGHEGFEIVDAIELTTGFMNHHIAPILNYELAEIYQSICRN